MRWKNKDLPVWNQMRRVKRFAWIPVFNVQNPFKETVETYTIWLETYHEIQKFNIKNNWEHHKNELFI